MCICGRDGGRGRGGWDGDGDEGGVVDAVAVYFADVEVGLYGFYVGGGDVVGGAVDWGGGFCRLLGGWLDGFGGVGVWSGRVGLGQGGVGWGGSMGDGERMWMGRKLEYRTEGWKEA